MLYKDSRFWLYVTHEDHEFQTNIINKEYENEWIKVSNNGNIIIKGSHIQENKKGGYAWDGCSPKFAFLDLVIGTPDGVIDKNTEKPKTYFASMVHDALYQIGHQADIKRLNIDRLFLVMLKDFKLRYIYYISVRLLGAFFFKKRKKLNEEK